MSGSHMFTCESCGASVIVDDRVRASALRDGCPLCLAQVTEGDFEPAESSETSAST